ncbi:MAG: hypothetical protein JSR31_11970 [Nitrospira sp.]|nr:hypothetical protein [Nitrospira sp.]
MTGWITLLALLLTATVGGCAQDPFERRGHPAGYNRYDVERDYMECEYKARLANEQYFYSQSSLFPFSGGAQSPADHARALHGLSTINALRDTCLTAKGYQLN